MLPSLERALQTLYTVNTRNDRREEDSQAVLREQTLPSSDLTPALSGVGQDSAACHNVNTVDEDILRQCSLDSKSFGAAGWPNTLSHKMGPLGDANRSSRTTASLQESDC